MRIMPILLSRTRRHLCFPQRLLLQTRKFFQAHPSQYNDEEREILYITIAICIENEKIKKQMDRIPQKHIH